VRRDSELQLEEAPQPAVLPTDPEDVMWNSLLFVAVATVAAVVLRVI
jgi:hypothetical protein